ncbi:MAG: hypothetical protein NVS2B7_10180 [Herpetosiphon sp.]
MAGNKALRRGIAELKRSIKRTVAAAQSGEGRTVRRVQHAGKINIEIQANVGQSGSHTESAAIQYAPIDQHSHPRDVDDGA